MKKALLLTLSLLLSSCVASNPYRNTADSQDRTAGFFNGFWDGAIAPMTFIVSLFASDVAVYNPHSDGWYTFGFMMGIGALSQSSTSAQSKD